MTSAPAQIGQVAAIAGQDDLAALFARVSRQSGIPLRAILAIAATRTEAGDLRDLAALERRLLRRSVDFRALGKSLAQPASEPEIGRLRSVAADALAAGQFAEVDRNLVEIERHVFGGARDLDELSRERRREAGQMRADRAGVSLLGLGPQAYREAADRYREAAAIVGLADPERSHGYALAHAEALARLGGDFADAAGYEAAIGHLRALLAGLDNFEDTLPWAATQERLGLTLDGLAALMQDKSTDAASDEALACWRAALDDLSPAQAPELWIRLQRHLGTLALRLGERREETDLLEEAVQAFKAVLGRSASDAGSESGARARYDLACAFAAVGSRTGDVGQLEGAFNVFTKALEHWTREADPSLWAEIHDRIGSVLSGMGERYREPVVLEEAIAAFGAALEERRRETQPLLWATSSANQGLATLQLAERRQDAGLAQQALAQITVAIEALRTAGFDANARELQKKLSKAVALLGALRRS